VVNYGTEVEPGIHEVTDDEGCVIFDNAARHYLNMSGEEFLRAWKQGRFSRSGCEDTRVTYVSMLIPLVEDK